MRIGRAGLRMVIPPLVGPLVSGILLFFELFLAPEAIGVLGWVSAGLALVGAALAARWPYVGCGFALAALLILVFLPGTTVLGTTFASLWIGVALGAQKGFVAYMLGVAALWGVTITGEIADDPVQPIGSVIQQAGILGLMFFGIGFIGLLLRRYQHLAQGVVHGMEKERELFRRALSRDLHDSAVHTMTSMVMRANQALVRGDLDEAAREDLQFIADVGKEGVQDLRRTLSSLRRSDALPDDAPKVDARWFEARLRSEGKRLEASGFSVQLPEEVPASGVDSQVLMVSGRILVEVVNNVLRHGKPKSEVVLMVENDGHTFGMMCINLIGAVEDDPERTRLGVLGMTELAETFGGTVSARVLGPRWVTNVEIPCSGTVARAEPVAFEEEKRGSK